MFSWTLFYMTPLALMTTNVQFMILGLVLGDIKISASDYCISHVMQLQWTLTNLNLSNLDAWIIRTGYCQERNCPPENFYPRVKFFSDCVENFCPTLKNFVRPAGHVWHCFPRHFQCCWLHVNVFPTIYNLFHHTPRIISDFFPITRRVTPRVTVMRIQSDNHNGY